ncbi:MAG: Arc family DNA binding domain-containing protein [Bacteroidetes bacterium 4484_276]|nr:MAG: Arc family DNA binding domain-containing protein [Bacteroidetes bacterium 4484_276]OYT13741.1 MAG: Arc family DNA binding domain-containing protein [Bacteroidetes bacterium 4572_114]
MPKKKPFVLRLNPEMFERLEKWSADEFRSTNGQIEWILDQALKKAGRAKKETKPENPEE